MSLEWSLLNSDMSTIIKYDLVMIHEALVKVQQSINVSDQLLNYLITLNNEDINTTLGIILVNKYDSRLQTVLQHPIKYIDILSYAVFKYASEFKPYNSSTKFLRSKKILLIVIDNIRDVDINNLYYQLLQYADTEEYSRNYAERDAINYILFRIIDKDILLNTDEKAIHYLYINTILYNAPKTLTNVLKETLHINDDILLVNLASQFKPIDYISLFGDELCVSVTL